MARTCACLAALLVLGACSNPRFGAGILVGPDGVSVTPSLSGQIGGAHVTING